MRGDGSDPITYILKSDSRSEEKRPERPALMLTESFTVQTDGKAATWIELLCSIGKKTDMSLLKNIISPLLIIFKIGETKKNVFNGVGWS